MFYNLELKLSFVIAFFIIIFLLHYYSSLVILMDWRNSRKLVNLQTLLVGNSGLSLQNMFIQLNCTKLN